MPGFTSRLSSRLPSHENVSLLRFIVLLSGFVLSRCAGLLVCLAALKWQILLTVAAINIQVEQGLMWIHSATSRRQWTDILTTCTLFVTRKEATPDFCVTPTNCTPSFPLTTVKEQSDVRGVNVFTPLNVQTKYKDSVLHYIKHKNTVLLNTT